MGCPIVPAVPGTRPRADSSLRRPVGGKTPRYFARAPTDLPYRLGILFVYGSRRCVDGHGAAGARTSRLPRCNAQGHGNSSQQGCESALNRKENSCFCVFTDSDLCKPTTSSLQAQWQHEYTEAEYRRLHCALCLRNRPGLPSRGCPPPPRTTRRFATPAAWRAGTTVFGR